MMHLFVGLVAAMVVGSDPHVNLQSVAAVSTGAATPITKPFYSFKDRSQAVLKQQILDSPIRSRPRADKRETPNRH